MIEVQENDIRPPRCMDCVHFMPHPVAPNSLSLCGRSALIFNPIDGEERRRFCDNEREPHGACGPEARHFQPQDNPDHQNPT